MNKDRVTFASEYDGLPINTDVDQKQGCHEKILDRIKDNFDYMTEHHNKIFFMRYDVRFPADNCDHPDNRTFRDFNANLLKNLNRQGLDPHSVWVREQSREKHQHYHGILLMDGNKIQSTHNPIRKAEELWAKALDLPADHAKGLVDDCTKGRDGSVQKNGVMMRKDDPQYHEKVKQCFHWASYLAKDNTKDKRLDGVRSFGASRIPNSKG